MDVTDQDAGAFAAAVAADDAVIRTLTHDLQAILSFAEECRWHFPQLSQDATALTNLAWAMLDRALRSLPPES